MRALIARDVMNPEVLAVRDEMTVAQLAEFLVDQQISGAPVEDVQGTLVGVVSLTDVARSLGDHGRVVPDHSEPSFYLRGWEEKFNPEDVAGLRVAESELTVGEIMTPRVYAVEDETPVDQVAERMVDGRLHRLLVTHDRRVVGIVTTTDLLGLLVDERMD
jgi:CBS domain-containing protein